MVSGVRAAVCAMKLFYLLDGDVMENGVKQPDLVGKSLPDTLARCTRKNANVRQIPVPLRIIESVSDHKLVRNRETEIIRRKRVFSTGWLVQKSCNTQRFGSWRKKSRRGTLEVT